MLDRDAQRRIASALFNRAWTLMEQDKRSEAEDAEMLHSALVPGVHVHLAAASLARGELDAMAEPLEQRHGRPAGLREQRVRQAGHEQCDAHAWSA